MCECIILLLVGEKERGNSAGLLLCGKTWEFLIVRSRGWLVLKNGKMSTTPAYIILLRLHLGIEHVPKPGSMSTSIFHFLCLGSKCQSFFKPFHLILFVGQTHTLTHSLTTAVCGLDFENFIQFTAKLFTYIHKLCESHKTTGITKWILPFSRHHNNHLITTLWPLLWPVYNIIYSYKL